MSIAISGGVAALLGDPWLYSAPWERDRESPLGGFSGLALFSALLALIAGELIPDYRFVASILVLLAGVVALGRWLYTGNASYLYLAGMFGTAALPVFLVGLGFDNAGEFGFVGTGYALIFVAGIRYLRNGGWGWQGVVGIFTLGVAAIAIALGGGLVPPAAAAAWPIIIGLGSVIGPAVDSR